MTTEPSNVPVSGQASDSPHHLEEQRRANRARIESLGLLPYGQRPAGDGLVTLGEGRRRYDADADAAHQAAGKQPPAGYVDARPYVEVAGRIMLLRDGGKLVWLTLRDHTGDLQVAVSARDVDEKSFALVKALDLGDVVIARGRLMKTRTGEITVWASPHKDGAQAVDMGAKCLTQPPEKHAGLQDVELRYRRRYVDLWANPETAGVFQLRSKVMSRVRRFLDERGYLEVETPVLQQLAGGAAARPFATHMNALDIGLYLRIAPELYLKRLLVGGLPRVYELSRNFRNEGLDKSHNPEFTMLEAYHAFGDVETMMELVESLIREAAQTVAVHLQDVAAKMGAAEPAAEDALPVDLRLPFGETLIDYGSAFLRVGYGELFEKALGFAMTDSAKVRAEAKKRGVKTKNDKGEDLADVLIVNELFEEFAEPTLDHTRPTFITHYPAAISPLTRPNPQDPSIADRADLFIGGMEVAPLYTELNDPDVQAAKFREQLAGIDDEEQTFRTFDQDFIDALKVGMPPAGGLGLGIDRLMMLLANQRTIRDVLLFPMMRPLS